MVSAPEVKLTAKIDMTEIDKAMPRHEGPGGGTSERGRQRRRAVGQAATYLRKEVLLWNH